MIVAARRLLVLVILLAACSDSGSTGAGGSGPGGSCDPTDEDCVCGQCDGVCESECSNDYDTWACHEPPVPADGQFPCGPWQTVCDTGQACIEEVPPGDGCKTYSCAPVPDACADEPSCACLAPYVDDQPFDELTCAGDDGAPTVKILGPADELPWDAPACGVRTCDDGESCWDCLMEGDAPRVPTCAAEDPSTAPGRCNLRWAPEPG